MESTTLEERLKKLPEALKAFKFKELRKHQQRPIMNALRGLDQIVVLPTGGGKSAVYSIPAICGGMRVLAFFPLVALIKDQVEKLLGAGLRAGALSHLFTNEENKITLREWKRGDLDFLLVAPERLSNEPFMQALKITPPNMVVVDEIHVASEHAFNFRPDYRNIAPLVRELQPEIFLGLTATMTPSVEDDLREIFQLEDAECVVEYYERANLQMEIVNGSLSKHTLMKELNSNDGPTIVYFSTVKRLMEYYSEIGHGIKGGCAVFHGSMPPASKESSQNEFMSGGVRVVFATVAFGMGVDKSDIRNVYYASVPGSIEELVQGWGRGGRDDAPCSCRLFWDPGTLSTQEFFMDIGYPTVATMKAVLRAFKRRMDQNKQYFGTIKDLFEDAGVQPAYASSVLAILYSEKVLVRVENDGPLRIRFLPDGDQSLLTKGQKGILDAILEYGVKAQDGAYEVPLAFLAEQSKRTESGVHTALTTMHKRQVVDYTNPEKSRPIQLIGDFNEQKSAKLQHRRRAAEQRFRALLELQYCSPDELPGEIKTYFTKNAE